MNIRHNPTSWSGARVNSGCSGRRVEGNRCPSDGEVDLRHQHLAVNNLSHLPGRSSKVMAFQLIWTGPADINGMSLTQYRSEAVYNRQQSIKRSHENHWHVPEPSERPQRNATTHFGGSCWHIPRNLREAVRI